ncbi:AAA family ATPase [Nocardia asteroides]|uniref:AAA family ATPase n=1 Tax=Nocardia asteroides TaxID=1824 RepID=UPI0034215F1B
MDKLLVLVNGLPGSGKSTLGRALAPELNAQFLSKDTVKESLATCLDTIDPRVLGGIAMDTVWALAGAVPGTVVIDSWWFKPRDLQHARTGILVTEATHAVEVWCSVDAATAKSRYANRQRPAIHQDTRRLAVDWTGWAAEAAPLGLTSTLVVDTTGPIDCARLADRIRHVATPVSRITATPPLAP